MANNRYFLLCPCGSTHYLGKSIGDGIYNTSTASGRPNSWAIGNHEGLPTVTPAATNERQGSGYGAFLGSVYEWMWEHLMECAHPDADHDAVLGPEWAKGELFKVITEYDDRAPSGPIPPYVHDPKDVSQRESPGERPGPRCNEG